METRAFQPLYTPSAAAPGGLTIAGTLAPSTTIGASTVATTNAAPFSGMTNNQIVQIQIANQTSAWVFVNFGVWGQVQNATVAGSYPVAPGAVVVVSVANEVTGASVIQPAGSTAGNVTFTRGEGL